MPTEMPIREKKNQNYSY